MHILHVGKYFYPFAGGIENFMLDLLPALHRRGIQNSVLVHQSPQDPGRQDDSQQLACLQQLQRVRSHGQFAYAPISPGFGYALAKMIDSCKPDLLHLHVPNTSAFWALLLPSARRLPWLVHWHADAVGPSLDRRLRLLYPCYRPFEQALLRRAQAIIVTSPAYLHSSTALARWHHKCQVLPLGLDPQRLQQRTADRIKTWRQEGCLRLLAVGRLTRYKGFALLLRAVAAVAAVELVIAGDGDQRHLLQQQVRVLGLSGRVHLLGGISAAQRNSLLAACDVLCLPALNRAEAFGLILLEAMAMAKPVIAADVPGSGMAWVVDDKSTGRLFPAGDATALANLLRELHQDHQQRQQLGANARRKFESQFHIDNIARETEQLYAQLLT
ncbi:MAG: glycosyltransferase [Gammaproteobacteria bacterium]|jgi:glycosyltransferase involved in cell wall biosynthesis|nr:glycosyltransferase [Gammaproteobacteria bacterium]